jgi:hypothetical protein
MVAGRRNGSVVRESRHIPDPNIRHHSRGPIVMTGWSGPMRVMNPMDVCGENQSVRQNRSGSRSTGVVSDVRAMG